METNKFLRPGAERAPAVEDLFALLAPRYDLINDLQSLGLHRKWKRRLARLAGAEPGRKVLDVCCGTGDVAFALREFGAEVTALDFSQAMLAVAAERARRARLLEANPAQFLQGDAMQLPFADASFDSVTTAYGLRNLASWERGLEEMWRVTRPGGRLLVLDFGKPENPLWRGFYFFYLRNFVPLFGRLFCGDAAPYAYIHASLQIYPAQRGVAEKMRALGCRETRVINVLGGAMSINYGVK